MFTEPVKGKDFFGRADILELLNKRVNALLSGYRQNVALTGEMLTGKTSILHHFLDNLKTTSLIPIYIEVKDRSFPAFAQKFIATILYAYLRSEGKPVTESVESLIATAQSVIPCTTACIKSIQEDIAKRRYTVAYRKLLEITSVIKEETSKPCVVILDEFHNIESFNIKNPFMHLGKIIMIQKGTMYIVSSSQRTTVRNILRERLSLLFGNFEVLEIEGFDTRTARTFLREKLLPMTINDYYVDYLVYLTGKNPFYLDMISKAVKNDMQKSGGTRVTVEVIRNVFAELLFDPTGVLHQHFTSQLNFDFDRPRRRRYLNILVAMANGATKLKTIEHESGSDERSISDHLDNLAAMDLIVKCGIFYKIRDRLFEFWLRNVYYKREHALVDPINGVMQEFKRSVENDIEQYLIEYNKEPVDRLKELYGNFQGEMVELDKKVRRLPKFITIEVTRYGKDIQYLNCRAQSKYWICEIHNNKVEESDIIDFIGLKSKASATGTRKVLVPLQGIDRNALLLAKEKQIWVWDVDKLNTLFGLYNKQGMVI